MSGKRKEQTKRICIACGGSAGHIFPGLVLARQLVNHHGNRVDISFLTSSNKLARAIFEENHFRWYAMPTRYQHMPTADQTSQWVIQRHRLLFMGSLLKNFLRSFRIMLTNRPHCFVGFGSYLAGPPFITSLILCIPRIIHEQNAVMGKANRIMQYLATKVAVSFPCRNGEKKSNIVYTGIPLREEALTMRDKKAALESLQLRQDRHTLLVVGGSQGSRKINTVVLQMCGLMNSNMRSLIQVIHITGEHDYRTVQKGYEELCIVSRVYPFFKNMGVVYSAADVAISRAGASTLFELCAHSVPVILIPYPHAESHQLENAHVLESQGAAIVLTEERLSDISLLDKFIRLINNDRERATMAEKMKVFKTEEAAKLLAEEVGMLAGL